MVSGQEGLAMRAVSCNEREMRAGRPEEKSSQFLCLAGAQLDLPAWLFLCRWHLQIYCLWNLLSKNKFIVSKNLLTKFAQGQFKSHTENQNFYRICLHKKCSQKSNLLTSRICFAKFAHRIWFQQRKIAHNEKPCRLGWFNTTAKILASWKFEHGWRKQYTGLKLDDWNVVWPDLPNAPNSYDMELHNVGLESPSLRPLLGHWRPPSCNSFLTTAHTHFKSTPDWYSASIPCLAVPTDISGSRIFHGTSSQLAFFCIASSGSLRLGTYPTTPCSGKPTPLIYLQWGERCQTSFVAIFATWMQCFDGTDDRKKHHHGSFSWIICS